MSYQITKQLGSTTVMNRVVWTVVDDYAKCHPNMTIQQIKKVFSSVHTDPDPCVEEWNVAIHHTTQNGTPDKRYCDHDPDDKIKVADGYVTVSTQWRDNPTGGGKYDNNFNEFRALAKKLGYDIV